MNINCAQHMKAMLHHVPHAQLQTHLATCSSHTSALIKSLQQIRSFHPPATFRQTKKLTNFLCCISKLIKKYSLLYDLAL